MDRQGSPNDPDQGRSDGFEPEPGCHWLKAHCSDIRPDQEQKRNKVRLLMQSSKIFTCSGEVLRNNAIKYAAWMKLHALGSKRLRSHGNTAMVVLDV